MSEAIRDGKYAARPVQWGLGLTKLGKEQAEIQFEILSAEYAGRHVTYFGSFSENAVKHTMNALWNSGFVGVDLEAITTTQPPEGVEVQLVIENEEYPVGSGEFSTKVKWVNKPFGLVSKPMEQTGVKAFAARMKGVIAGLDPEQAKKKPAPKPQQLEDAPF